MTARLLGLFTTLLLACRVGCAHAEPILAPSIGHVEVKAELPKEPPYVGEPILLRVRWSVRANVMLEQLIQPTMTNFDWQQFGIDASTNGMVDGFLTPIFERVLMITPLKAGVFDDPTVRAARDDRDGAQRERRDGFFVPPPRRRGAIA